MASVVAWLFSFVLELAYCFFQLYLYLSNEELKSGKVSVAAHASSIGYCELVAIAVETILFMYYLCAKAWIGAALLFIPSIILARRVHLKRYEVDYASVSTNADREGKVCIIRSVFHALAWMYTFYMLLSTTRAKITPVRRPSPHGKARR